jgi:hypothetical protein
MNPGRCLSTTVRFRPSKLQTRFLLYVARLLSITSSLLFARHYRSHLYVSISVHIQLTEYLVSHMKTTKYDFDAHDISKLSSKDAMHLAGVSGIWVIRSTQAMLVVSIAYRFP